MLPWPEESNCPPDATEVMTEHGCILNTVTYSTLASKNTTHIKML